MEIGRHELVVGGERQLRPTAAGGIGAGGVDEGVDLAKFREQLLERIRLAGIDQIDPADERVLKEVVIFADRSDISEEIARLDSHFAQFADCLQVSEPMGRKLDFLAQEMNREINTIGSKANDARIATQVVNLKTELERFREQAQNVE
jgi:uncharacterized protein (TIGR00255 family)